MDKELLTKLEYKKETYRRWKQGQGTQDEYRDFFKVCRDGVLPNSL